MFKLQSYIQDLKLVNFNTYFRRLVKQKKINMLIYFKYLININAQEVQDSKYSSKVSLKLRALRKLIFFPFFKKNKIKIHITYYKSKQK